MQEPEGCRNIDAEALHVYTQTLSAGEYGSPDAAVPTPRHFAWVSDVRRQQVLSMD